MFDIMKKAKELQTKVAEIQEELNARNITADEAIEAVEKEAIEDLKEETPSLNTDWSGNEIKYLKNKGGTVMEATPILIQQMKVMELIPCNAPDNKE